jgi:hypothetical protein
MKDNGKIKSHMEEVKCTFLMVHSIMDISLWDYQMDKAG